MRQHRGLSLIAWMTIATFGSACHDAVERTEPGATDGDAAGTEDASKAELPQPTAGPPEGQEPHDAGSGPSTTLGSDGMTDYVIYHSAELCSAPGVGCGPQETTRTRHFSQRVCTEQDCPVIVGAERTVVNHAAGTTAYRTAYRNECRRDCSNGTVERPVYETGAKRVNCNLPYTCAIALTWYGATGVFDTNGRPNACRVVNDSAGNRQAVNIAGRHDRENWIGSRYVERFGCSGIGCPTFYDSRGQDAEGKACCVTDGSTNPPTVALCSP